MRDNLFHRPLRGCFETGRFVTCFWSKANRPLKRQALFRFLGNRRAAVDGAFDFLADRLGGEVEFVALLQIHPERRFDA